MASWPETKPLSEANLSDLVDRIIQAENNIEIGKSAIVDAILDMNQTATIGMTHTQLAALIRSISNDANAALSDVLSGRTFYQGGQKRTGTLSLTGNATAAQVLSGRTFYNTNAKSKQTGTMPNRGAGGTVTPGRNNQTKASGYYSSAITILGDNDLIANNIRQGVNIFGVNGNLRPWNGEKRYAEGQGTTSGSSGSLTVTGLGFTPSIVLLSTTGASTTRWVTYWGGRSSSNFVYSSSFPYTSGSITHYEDPDPISVSGNSFTASIRASGQDVLWIAVE